METPRVYVICDQNCKFESMTKEQILTAIMQAVNEGTIENIDAGFVQTIKTVNGVPLRFFVGEQSAYDALNDEEKQNLFAIITNDTTKEGILNSIKELQADINTLFKRVNKIEPVILSNTLVIGGAYNSVDCVDDLFNSYIVAEIRIKISATNKEYMRFKTKPFSFRNAEHTIATYCESYEIATTTHADGHIDGYSHIASDKLVFAASKAENSTLYVAKTNGVAGYTVELLSVHLVERNEG